MRINEEIEKLLPPPKDCVRFKIGDCLCHMANRDNIFKIIGYTENHYIMEIIKGSIGVGQRVSKINDNILQNYIKIIVT